MATEFQIKALTIIRDNPGIHANQLSEKLWPESIAHKRSYNVGHGAARGVGAWLAAGSYVGKLRKKGLVRYHLAHSWDGEKDVIDISGYEITSAGRELLEEAENS